MKPNRCNAFSLVEVAIAIGISAFSMIAVMGLLQVGLGNFRGAIDRSAHARIGRTLIEESTISNFSSLVSPAYLGSFPRFFSEEGIQVEADDASLVYTAQAIVERDGGVQAGASLGRLPSGVEQKALVRVLFTIKSARGGGTPYKVMVALADNGK